MGLRSEKDIPSYWVILPTFCEAENLPAMLRRLGSLTIGLNVLVVDDNSMDGTADLAEQYAVGRPNIHLLRRASKEGLGAAYLAGFSYAIEAGADVVITMDCDFSHQPEALPALVAAMGDAGCLVGSRYIEGGSIENWPLRRKFLSAAANRFVRALFRMPIRDCTSGFRIYRRQVIDDILSAAPRSQGYSFLVEALQIAVTGPLPVRESPICFVERVSGDSKMGLREILTGASTLVFVWARSYVGKPVPAVRPQPADIPK